ncbi:MAG: hypothetical protein KAJ91_01650, partial [Candidatus Aenigmarchaeota archaeon]|nr:hypothetical protein [Candidatus Aenigmarchaeota archaeon]
FVFYSYTDISKCFAGRNCVFENEQSTTEEDQTFLENYNALDLNQTQAFMITTKPGHALMLKFIYPELRAGSAEWVMGNSLKERRKIFSRFDVYYFDEKDCPEKWIEYCNAVLELPKTAVMRTEGLDVYKIDV